MRKQFVPTTIATFGFLVLILDTKTALSGAAEGIRLCLQTVIPSLFPFLFLSVMLTSGLDGHSIAFLKPLCRHLRIPDGAESLLIVGLVGGYPVGAQCVAEAARSGIISRENAERMLSFCSNAGPAFLFGIGSSLFAEKWMCWALWGIHIVSALLVGFIIPGGSRENAAAFPSTMCSATQALQRSLRVMATICGWVVIFRVILVFCQRWFLWLLPVWAQCLLAGILELTNGCCALAQIDQVPLRFVLCALMISFGGLCVTMQTYSVTQGVDARLYLPGKLLQSLLSGLLATVVISREMIWMIATILVIVLLFCIFRKKSQKGIAFFPSPLYNRRNTIGGNCHAVSQEDPAPMRLLHPRHRLK